MLREVLSNIVDNVAQIENAFKTLKLDLFFSVIINVVVIVVLFKLINVFVAKLKDKFKNSENKMISGHLIPIFERLTKFIIVFVVVASFLQSSGYSITSLIAGFGITGLAVGFAAQQTIADFFGTLSIIADKMYKIGDYVIYGTNGVCEIEDITEKPFEGAPRDKVYYVLLVVNTGSRMYVPLELGNAKMRKVMNKAEAQSLIKQIPNIKPLELDDDKQVEETYKEILHSNECTDLIRLIKCIHNRKVERLEQKKQVTSTDRKYMELAEDALYLELGTALGIKKSEVLPIILKEAHATK